MFERHSSRGLAVAALSLVLSTSAVASPEAAYKIVEGTFECTREAARLVRGLIRNPEIAAKIKTYGFQTNFAQTQIQAARSMSDFGEAAFHLSLLGEKRFRVLLDAYHAEFARDEKYIGKLYEGARKLKPEQKQEIIARLDGIKGMTPSLKNKVSNMLVRKEALHGEAVMKSLSPDNETELNVLILLDEKVWSGNSAKVRLRTSEMRDIWKTKVEFSKEDKYAYRESEKWTKYFHADEGEERLITWTMAKIDELIRGKVVEFNQNKNSLQVLESSEETKWFTQEEFDELESFLSFLKPLFEKETIKGRMDKYAAELAKRSGTADATADPLKNVEELAPIVKPLSVAAKEMYDKLYEALGDFYGVIAVE